MKYTIDSLEFLAAYNTLSKVLETTNRTCRTFGKPTCKGCIFDDGTNICDPFIDLRSIFNEKKFKEKYPELFI